MQMFDRVRVCSFSENLQRREMAARSAMGCLCPCLKQTKCKSVPCAVEYRFGSRLSTVGGIGAGSAVEVDCYRKVTSAVASEKCFRRVPGGPVERIQSIVGSTSWGGNEEIARSREQGTSLVNRQFISFFLRKNKGILEAGV
jgi:hypothetical protein